MQVLCIHGSKHSTSAALSAVDMDGLLNLLRHGLLDAMDGLLNYAILGALARFRNASLNAYAQSNAHYRISRSVSRSLPPIKVTHRSRRFQMR